MAVSSSRSSRGSASSSRGGEGQHQMRSPVPYRVGPLDYSPAVMCRCGRKTPCWISWSDENPGRRYYRCPSGLMPGDCSFFRWIDREATEFERQLLCDLCDAIFQLRRDNREARQVNELLQRKVADIIQGKEQLLIEKAELLQKLEQIEGAMADRDSKLKHGSSFMFCWCIAVVVVAVGVLFPLMLKEK
ncbi:unnamed protein product [Urochloa decumbens]|uniref:GRF-type domain-containing protein n=1 Tax=Urochloa decumbens TaxID=240449 RepID=A0ABC8VXF1_9POAL